MLSSTAYNVLLTVKSCFLYLENENEAVENSLQVSTASFSTTAKRISIAILVTTVIGIISSAYVFRKMK